MPPVSQAQRKAMFAAKAGKSTLGIPKKVGADFAAADPGGKLPEYKKPKKKGYDRSSHQPGNPGFPSAEVEHEAREKQVMGAGYEAHEKAFGDKGHEHEQSMAHPKGYDRSSHHKGNPGFGSSTPHTFQVSGQRREGHLRLSGHSGAHRIGKR